MRYAIENGVPMPETRGEKDRFPLDELKIGQSFVLGIEEVSAARSAMHRKQKKTGKEFAYRNVDGVHRIWRTK